MMKQFLYANGLAESVAVYLFHEVLHTAATGPQDVLMKQQIMEAYIMRQS